ncbi:MAG: hypothetical protein J5615_01660 [Fibrobacter sp.]|nr:hypothetical protein [Fibrobacter sp.]
MAAHSDKRLERAMALARDCGISIRKAYRRRRNIEVADENTNFDYEAETPKGEWV